MSVWMRHSIVFVGVVHVSLHVLITVFCVRVSLSVSVLKTTRHSAWKLSIGEHKHHHRVVHRFKNIHIIPLTLPDGALKQTLVEITQLGNERAESLPAFLTGGLQLCFELVSL